MQSPLEAEPAELRSSSEQGCAKVDSGGLWRWTRSPALLITSN